MSEKESKLEELKTVQKRLKEEVKKLEGSEKWKRLKVLESSIKSKLKKIERVEREKKFQGLNDIKVNIIHTKEGLQRRVEDGIVMNEGNFVRLLNAFMYFTDCVNKDLPLLDIGTREGWFLEFLIKAGYKDVQAIEICQEGVDQVKAKGLRCTKMDVQKMPFQNLFGTITAIHVLEHCSNPQIVVHNIYNALMKEGILYIEIPLESDANPNKSAHFSSFPRKEVLFNLFDARWSLLKNEVVNMNNIGTKRNLRSVFRKAY